MKEKMIHRISPKLKKGEKIFANQIFNTGLYREYENNFQNPIARKQKLSKQFEQIFEQK